MKIKKWIITLTFGMVLGVTSVAFGAGAATIYIDGQKLPTTQAPTSENDRILVPFRDVFEAFGMQVDWQKESQTITATDGKTSIAFTLNASIATVNGTIKELDAPAKAINGVTVVPIRFVAETLNYPVKWDSEHQRVIIGKEVPYNPIDDMYLIPGTGEYAGYRQLKGYPGEELCAIHVEGTAESHHIVSESIEQDLATIYTWTYEGQTYRNTKSELYGFFSNTTYLSSRTGYDDSFFTPQ